jgi:hypothetical protein
MLTSASWRKQYERMIRWRHRFWLDVSINQDDAADIFFTFAQCCAHLVDWLENDRSQPIRRSVAEEYVATSSALAFCRDFSNGSKHARLEAKKIHIAPGTTVEPLQIGDSSEEPREITVTRTRLFFDWDGRAIDGESFARICVAEWDRFLREKGLLDREAVVTVLIEAAAYSTLSAMTSHLPASDMRRIASVNAIRLTGGSGWILSYSPEAAPGICELLKVAEQCYREGMGNEQWARICRSTIEIITTEAGKSPPTC